MEQKKVEDMTGEEIAIALQARYQGIAQMQQEIALLNQELQKRMEKKNNSTEVFAKLVEGSEKAV